MNIMSLCTRTVLKKLFESNICRYSTATKLQDASLISAKLEGVPSVTSNLHDVSSTFRTNECNPANHTKEHLYKFYTMPKDIHTRLFQFGGYTKAEKKLMQGFNEYAFLIRQPALEIISYINQTNFKKPVNKYVLYGTRGGGKTSLLLHLTYYAHLQKFILVHAPMPCVWFQYPREVVNSVNPPGLMDLPLDACLWLIHFKSQNELLLKELDIRVNEEHEWSSWEKTEKDSPLIDLVEFGINRTKYSSQVISKLMKELKQSCNADKCKVFVTIDGFNTFYVSKTMIRNDNKMYVPAWNITLTQSFLDITKADWCNGVVVVSTCTRADLECRESDYPRYLLRKEGFDHLDPFLPIHVDNYNEAEFRSVIEYYKDRKWIRNISDKGTKELQILSGLNGYKLLDYTAAL